MKTRNNPRPIAERLRRLLRLLSRSRRGVILIHGNPDPDALASAFALQLLARSVAGRIQIRFTGRVHRLERERGGLSSAREMKYHDGSGKEETHAGSALR